MCYFSTCTLWFLTDLFEKASYDVLHYRSDQSKNMIIYWKAVLGIEWCNSEKIEFILIFLNILKHGKE